MSEISLSFRTNSLPAHVLRPRTEPGTIMNLFGDRLDGPLDANGPWRVDVTITAIEPPREGASA